MRDLVWYGLDGKPISMREADKLLRDGEARRVQVTQISDDVRVSTVFLPIDHGYGDGPPVLWETMIFGGEHDQYQDRYTSRDDAEIGHWNAVNLALGIKGDGR